MAPGGDLLECEVQCPYCGEEITIFVDPSVSRQTYVEDCTVCCRPIRVDVECEEGELIAATPSKENE